MPKVIIESDRSTVAVEENERTDIDADVGAAFAECCWMHDRDPQDVIEAFARRMEELGQVDSAEKFLKETYCAVRDCDC
jgi:hypothetical protein